MIDIHTIEAKHADKVCLIKVKDPHYFAIEAKIGTNDWRSIGEIYPQIELASSYLEWDHAKFAKTKLKGLLLGPYKNQVKKRPIRIRKIFKVL